MKMVNFHSLLCPHRAWRLVDKKDTDEAVILTHLFADLCAVVVRMISERVGFEAHAFTPKYDNNNFPLW
jgi:hypothetical protein